MAIFSLQEELCAYIAIIPFDRIAIIQNGSLTIHMQITPSTSILLFIVATPGGSLRRQAPDRSGGRLTRRCS